MPCKVCYIILCFLWTLQSYNLIAQSIDSVATEKVKLLLSLSKKTLHSEPIVSLQYAEEALDSVRNLAKPILYTDVIYQLGQAYANIGENEPALKYFLEALQKYEYQLDNLHKATDVCNDIAGIYRYQKNTDKAIFYLEKAIQFEQRTKDNKAIATTYNQLGRVYSLLKNYDMALDYHQKALQLRKEIKDTVGLVTSLNNVGYVLRKKGKYLQSITFLKQSLDLNKTIKNYELRAATLDNLGDTYRLLNQPQEALRYLKLGLQQAIAIGAKNRILESYESFIEYYEAQKNFDTAFKYQKQYLQLKDSVFNATQSEQIARMNAVYHFEHQRLENERLRGEKGKQASEINLQNTTLKMQSRMLLLAGFALLLTILAVYILYSYNKKKDEHNKLLQSLNKDMQEQKEELVVQTEELNEANEEIKQLNEGLEQIVKERTVLLEATNKELDTFLYRTSHDFRRPITALKGLVEVANLLVKDEEILSLFDKVKTTAAEIDYMLYKLRQLSELYADQHNTQVIDFENVIKLQYQKCQTKLPNQNLETFYEINLMKPITGNLFLYSGILENLIENSFAFSKSSGAWVKTTIEQREEILVLKVEDNGLGIAPELQEKIFDMYFRGHEEAKGNGLGLYVAKNMINQLRGSIRVESTIDVGTIFSVEIPL